MRFAWRRAAGEFISVHSSVWVGAGNLNAVDIICLGQSRKLLCRRYNLSGPEYETFKLQIPLVWVRVGNLKCLKAVDTICLGESRKLLSRRYNLSGSEYETFKL